MLAAAEGRTAAGFGRRARRLRESRFPDLIPVRHRQAKDKRRVSFQPLPDGMSCLSAIIAAEKGQAMFAALTGAAKAGKHAGDPRTMDQLRADTLTELLLENQPPTGMRETQAAPGTCAGSDITANEPAPDPVPAPTPTAVTAPDPVPAPTPTAVTAPGPDGNPISGPAGSTQPGRRPRRAERHRTQNRNRSTVRTEVMVLINADTLAGLDENPAELNGYGPISAETARAMILDALHWTPLIQDPATGHILTVGRTRRIPSGLKRWLQARDGTCRFPGCSVSVTHAEIDHTKPFSRGGPTDHANLEHLCPKHHRFKTLGHWTARQPEPGTIEWHSPTGRTYATGPTLEYQHAEYQQPESQQAELQPTTRAPEQRRHPHPPSPEDDPPPF
ncbi:HNH endonuclease signature motif containing protein [Arthrobacter koreensis]|uniref:HNH endonuclease signature motif containing protein n=1 Tax=Arthrobacter koreensis TaxID=199136 RepID=UPI0036DAD062